MARTQTDFLSDFLQPFHFELERRQKVVHGTLARWFGRRGQGSVVGDHNGVAGVPVVYVGRAEYTHLTGFQLYREDTTIGTTGARVTVTGTIRRGERTQRAVTKLKLNVTSRWAPERNCRPSVVLLPPPPPLLPAAAATRARASRARTHATSAAGRPRWGASVPRCAGGAAAAILYGPGDNRCRCRRHPVVLPVVVRIRCARREEQCDFHLVF